MTRQQLVLLETPSAEWRLDDSTRAIGRRGLAEARSALRAAKARATAREHDRLADRTDHADAA
jgi:hypothetical protein